MHPNNHLKIALLLFFALPLARATKVEIQSARVYANNPAGFASKYNIISDASDRLDLSYFVLEDDASTSLLFQKVLERVAATRGAPTPLKVRVLVDYYMTPKQVPFLRFLNAQPGIEVRRYGPPSANLIAAMAELKIDGPLFVESLMNQDATGLKQSLVKAPMLAEFAQLLGSLKLVTGEDLSSAKHKWMMSIMYAAKKFESVAPKFVLGVVDFLHRTHQKLLVANGAKGICFQTGGRNLSNAYHTTPQDPLMKGQEYTFNDIDVAACLPAGTNYDESAPAQAFAKLWTSERTVGASFAYTTNEKKPELTSLAELNTKALAATHLLQSSESTFAVNATNGLEAYLLENGDITEAYIKLLDQINDDKTPAGTADNASFVNAYFYPETKWLPIDHAEPLARLARSLEAAGIRTKARGGNLTVRTNSFGSTDLNVVNLFAARKYRGLLEDGITLKELHKFTDPTKNQGSLHMKCVYITSAKGNWFLIGSYNLDPRSYLRDKNIALLVRVPPGQEATSAAFANAVDLLKWDEITLTGDKGTVNVQDLEDISNAKSRTHEILDAAKSEI